MVQMRRALGPIVALWVGCHLGQTLAVPALLWTRQGEALLECTCTHGDHAICPMHHKRARGSALCVMQSSSNGDAALLASVLTFVGAPAVSPRLLPPESNRVTVRLDIATASAHLTPPDPPPPRA
jgi:hypothetical protein